MLAGQSVTSTYGDEIDVETLIAVSEFTQAFALKIFKVDADA